MPCVPSLTSSNAAVQVVFYGGDLVRMMDAVLHGEVDVIILQGGWLEENFPQNIPLLQILAPKQLVYSGEPYPFLTSTELVPEVALSAAPHISGQLQQRILLALLALNSSTCPAMRAAGIAAFTNSLSYVVAVEVGVDTHVIRVTNHETTCFNQFDAPDEFVKCSKGYVQDSKDAAEIGCKRRGLPCPPGLACLCRPCIPVLEIYLFPWQVSTCTVARARACV